MKNLLDQLAAKLESSCSTFTTCPGAIDELVISNNAQRLTVRAVEYRRGPDHAVVLVAPICDERAASADRVLRLAATMGAGALAIVGGSYVVRFAIPAAQIESAPIEFIATYIHEVARTVRKELATNQADVSSLAHLAA
jgi:hypothetical protein